MNTLQFCTFEDVIKRVLTEEELDARAVARLLPLAVDGYFHIYKVASQRTKTVILPLSIPSLRILYFPVDYMDYSKVGIIVRDCNGSPKIMTLTRNPRLFGYTDEDIVKAQCDCDCEPTGVISTDTQMLIGGMNPYNYFSVFRNLVRGGQIVGELYGFGGGKSYAGAFNEDKYNGRFVFSTEVPETAHIALEYKANPNAANQNTKIPLECKEVVIAWTKWKMLNRRNSSIGEREEASNNYMNALESFSDGEVSVSASEIMDNLQSTFGYIRT